MCTESCTVKQHEHYLHGSQNAISKNFKHSNIKTIIYLLIYLVFALLNIFELLKLIERLFPKKCGFSFDF